MRDKEHVWLKVARNVMTNDGNGILLIIVVSLALWLTSKAIFAAYFKAREDYWLRFYRKVKGFKDGEKH